jgi:hypothetical protein
MSYILQDSIIKITNPEVIAFYEKNPHIQVDTVNLLLIELLKTTGPLSAIIPSVKLPGKESFQTTELIECQSKLKDVIHNLSKTIISQYIDAKTEYINEFKTIEWAYSDAKDTLMENNTRLITRMETIFSPLSKIKSHFCEKSTNIQRQFHKIINANIESIISKDAKIIAKEYINNFETNSTHMVQTIQQLLLDYLSAKDEQIDKTMQLLTQNDESASQSYYKIFYEINDVLHQFKSRDTSYPFETLISQIFSTASISQEDPGIIIHRENKPVIYVENYAIKDRNVNNLEIKSFLKTTQEKVNHGILISQFTGITSKPNFHIEIQNNRVLIYIHQMEYSADKLQIAVDMIDSISDKLLDFYSNAETKYSIPKEVLDDINREYQSFVLQKETISNALKDNYKKIIAQIDEIKFASLDKFLSTRYSCCKKQGFTCDICNNFHVGTLKGLAAHKRGCNRKLTRDSSDKTPIYNVKVKQVEQLLNST